MNSHSYNSLITCDITSPSRMQTSQGEKPSADKWITTSSEIKSRHYYIRADWTKIWDLPRCRDPCFCESKTKTKTSVTSHQNKCSKNKTSRLFARLPRFWDQMKHLRVPKFGRYHSQPLAILTMQVNIAFGTFQLVNLKVYRNMGYWPSMRSRWLDIGQVLFFACL